jgi:hypothetical protein
MTHRKKFPATKYFLKLAAAEFFRETPWQQFWRTLPEVGKNGKVEAMQRWEKYSYSALDIEALYFFRLRPIREPHVGLFWS